MMSANLKNCTDNAFAAAMGQPAWVGVPWLPNTRRNRNPPVSPGVVIPGRRPAEPRQGADYYTGDMAECNFGIGIPGDSVVSYGQNP